MPDRKIRQPGRNFGQSCSACQTTVYKYHFERLAEISARTSCHLCSGGSHMTKQHETANRHTKITGNAWQNPYHSDKHNCK